MDWAAIIQVVCFPVHRRVHCYCDDVCPPEIQMVVDGIGPSATASLTCGNPNKPGDCVIDMDGLPAPLTVRDDAGLQ